VTAAATLWPPDDSPDELLLAELFPLPALSFALGSDVGCRRDAFFVWSLFCPGARLAVGALAVSPHLGLALTSALALICDDEPIVIGRPSWRCCASSCRVVIATMLPSRRSHRPRRCRRRIRVAASSSPPAAVGRLDRHVAGGVSRCPAGARVRVGGRSRSRRPG
jgi:hypothetical protein